MRGRVLRRFAENQSGAVAAMYALSLVGLVVVAGVAFDYARLAGMDSELQNAADQAALAGATQLDGKSGACSRAGDKARTLVANRTLLANESGSVRAVTFQNETACDATGKIRFYQDKDKTTAATSDANARFVEVEVDARTANYALTPLSGLLNSGLITAKAMAGIGSSICKVPPLMICSPDPSVSFNAAGKKGWGVQATGHGGGGSSWGPGDFGFLEVGDGQKATLEKAIAFVDNNYDCLPIDGTKPETGNSQGLFRALNTRFDIYEDNGNPLNDCIPNGKCPAASNVIKDLVKPNTNTNGNACKIHNQGWQLPPSNRQFWPSNIGTDTDGDGLLNYNNTSHSPSIDAMGLPRDLCHYASYVGGVASRQCHNLNGMSSDTNDRYGTGNWARGDYFTKYHSGRVPAGAATMTRYETYKWEIANNYLASIDGSAAGSNKEYAVPKCSTGSAGTIDRRVLTVAIVKNCSSLAGGSTTVQVDEWVDVFLVEPVVDSRGNGVVTDSIYVEVIGPANIADSTGAAAQTIRRDVPYLVR